MGLKEMANNFWTKKFFVRWTMWGSENYAIMKNIKGY